MEGIMINSMVDVAREATVFTYHPKQPGRTYGPEPKSTVSGQGAPKGRRDALKAAKSARREAANA